MAASSDKKQSKKQVFDVNKPGKTPPDASSRPIIVTHHPMVQDPMVSEAEESGAEDNSPKTAPAVKATPTSHGEKVVQPLAKTETDEPADKAPDAEAEKPPAEETDTPTDKPQDTSASAAVESTAEEFEDKKAKKETDAKQEQEEQERRTAVEKLIEEKKYFVKVGEVHRRQRSRSMLTVLILLIVLAIGGYLAVDAGFIKTDITLPYDLIK